MLVSTPDWVRLALETSRARRSATAIFACMRAARCGRFAAGQCHSSTPGTPRNAPAGSTPPSAPAAPCRVSTTTEAVVPRDRAADDLGGAHQRGRPLELLGGEQPQRVPHEHGDAVAAVARVGARPDHALQPADREGVRGEPEVGLRLAAAGREEQQVDRRRRRGRPLRVDRVGQRGQVEQHEGELERPPGGVPRVLDGGEGLGVGDPALLAEARDGRVPALQRHHPVGEPERRQRLHVAGCPGVGEQNDTRPDAGGRSPAPPRRPRRRSRAAAPGASRPRTSARRATARSRRRAAPARGAGPRRPPRRERPWTARRRPPSPWRRWRARRGAAARWSPASRRAAGRHRAGADARRRCARPRTGAVGGGAAAGAAPPGRRRGRSRPGRRRARTPRRPRPAP